jgi:hypothetical protein
LTLDIAFELRRNGVEATLVGFDAPGGAHDALKRAHLRSLGSHAELLDLLGADGDGSGRRTGIARHGSVHCCGALVAFVHGDVVHAHRILLRHRRGVGQAHGVAVIKDLARRLLRRCGSRFRCAMRGLAPVADPVARAGGNGHQHHQHDGRRDT